MKLTIFLGIEFACDLLGGLRNKTREPSCSDELGCKIQSAVIVWPQTWYPSCKSLFVWVGQSRLDNTMLLASLCISINLCDLDLQLFADNEALPGYIFAMMDITWINA